MDSSEIQRLVEYYQTHLDLSDIQLGDEYGYENLNLCLIDAIFSIGVNYTSTQNTVARFIAHYNNVAPTTISDLLALYQQHPPDYIARNIFKNLQRTSTRNGILKAEAVRREAEVLLKHGVNSLPELTAVINQPIFEADFKKIPGQRSGISLRYFYMLTGSDADIKPDRMIIRFIKTALQRRVAVDDCHALLVETCNVLKKVHPELTPRSLDHVIWQFQRVQ